MTKTEALKLLAEAELRPITRHALFDEWGLDFADGADIAVGEVPHPLADVVVVLADGEYTLFVDYEDSAQIFVVTCREEPT